MKILAGPAVAAVAVAEAGVGFGFGQFAYFGALSGKLRSHAPVAAGTGLGR